MDGFLTSAVAIRMFKMGPCLNSNRSLFFAVLSVIFFAFHVIVWHGADVRQDNDLQAEKAACLVVSSVTCLSLFSLILRYVLCLLFLE